VDIRRSLSRRYVLSPIDAVTNRKLVEGDEDRQNLLLGIPFWSRHKISAAEALSTTVLVFALDPWTPELNRLLGRHGAGPKRAVGIEWNFGRKRALDLRNGERSLCDFRWGKASRLVGWARAD
jgi:hypothetical protein